ASLRLSTRLDAGNLAYSLLRGISLFGLRTGGILHRRVRSQLAQTSFICRATELYQQRRSQMKQRDLPAISLLFLSIPRETSGRPADTGAWPYVASGAGSDGW